ncbi:Raf [Bifidobacterium pseudolongum subsp. globosum]|nr:Raf [Bifidobacterium pseudolongum subsp. globosum]RYQ06506.1 Raf [Bifidobacterium pseudolongum subsp. globosum]RYQ13301.1 Raf [Bifidobacterium pseudolongum subsp. globosum]RYQ27252.1 Raf [Bifidobacterium pseudolongum subsp. globosum]RYQ27691.1 Raf [Bifidobacterium pseudolongum subsp. globosum]
MRHTGNMLITADFSIIPSAYAKDAPEDARVDSVPCVSFPFYIDQLNPRAKYLHWEFSDPDSIPVCGFEWIHWTVANLPVDAIMFDPSDAHALSIPADFSRSLPSMVPEALQGRNSSASPFLGRSSDPALIERYNGPQPPDKDHQYALQVWGTSEPVEGLEQGFWLNELLHGLERGKSVCDAGGVMLVGKA